jgi:hypothetical protein
MVAGVGALGQSRLSGQAAVPGVQYEKAGIPEGYNATNVGAGEHPELILGCNQPLRNYLSTGLAAAPGLRCNGALQEVLPIMARKRSQPKPLQTIWEVSADLGARIEALLREDGQPSPKGGQPPRD